MKKLLVIVSVIGLFAASAQAQQAAVRAGRAASQAAKEAPRVQAPTGSAVSSQTTVGASEAAQAVKVGTSGQALNTLESEINSFLGMKKEQENIGATCMAGATPAQLAAVRDAARAGIEVNCESLGTSQDPTVLANLTAILTEGSKALNGQVANQASFSAQVAAVKAIGNVAPEGVNTFKGLCELGCIKSALCSPRALQAAM